jgi:hypothetical protein
LDIKNKGISVLTLQAIELYVEPSSDSNKLINKIPSNTEIIVEDYDSQFYKLIEAPGIPIHLGSYIKNQVIWRSRNTKLWEVTLISMILLLYIEAIVRQKID